MSDEIFEQSTVPEQGLPPEEKPSLMPGFKSVCTRLGLVLIVIFGSRLLADVCSFPIAALVEPLRSKPALVFFVNALYSDLFLYAIPIIATIFILKHPLKKSPNRVYQKPKYLGKAMAMFPAGYGLAISVRLLTMLLSTLFKNTPLGESFDVVQDSLFAAPDIVSALIQFVQLAVIAPIFEELWFRGMIMESLRPYGNGFAIFISAIMFGLTHANFEQFFYATALGIFLGYIAISTQSIVTTTIMHAMFNSISGVMLLMSVDHSVQEYILAAGNGETAEITPMVILYLAWTGFIVLLLIVGIIMMIYKFVKIKRYKVPKVQTEISTGKRWGIFFSRTAVIIGFVMAAICFVEPAILKMISDAMPAA